MYSQKILIIYVCIPVQVIEILGYPKQIAKPEKQYIFTIPKEGMVFDYRYIKEVSDIY